MLPIAPLFYPKAFRFPIPAQSVSINCAFPGNRSLRHPIATPARFSLRSVHNRQRQAPLSRLLIVASSTFFPGSMSSRINSTCNSRNRPPALRCPGPAAAADKRVLYI